MPDAMSPFENAVLTIVRQIPRGMVVSYGQLALYAGKPGHAREAGAAMRTLGRNPDFPWWRVVNSEGKLSIAGNPDANAQQQQELLEQEGIPFRSIGSLSVERHRWRPDDATLRGFGLVDWMAASARHKYPEPPADLGL